MKACTIFDSSLGFYTKAVAHLNTIGNFIPPLFLRLILAIEFGTAGFEKFHGTNWFQEITFPFPFNLLPPELSWNIATYFEIFGAVALVFGFATRFFSISLVVLISLCSR